MKPSSSYYKILIQSILCLKEETKTAKANCFRQRRKVFVISDCFATKSSPQDRLGFVSTNLQDLHFLHRYLPSTLPNVSFVQMFWKLYL